MSDNLITVVLNPFGADRSRVIAYRDFCGQTVQDVIDSYWRAGKYDCVVSINGGKIDDLKTVIKAGDNVVLCAVVRGGGGDKDTLRTVAMIAVMIAATAVTGGAAFALSGALVGGSTAAALWGTAISIGGGLLVNALMPVQAPDFGPSTSLNTSSTYGWEPASNSVQEGLILPVVYGIAKIYPNIISRFTSLDSSTNEQTLSALYALGEGAISTVTEIKINDNLSTSYTGLTTATRLGTEAQTVIDGFQDQASDKSVNLTLTDNDFSATQTTDGTAVETLGIGLLFPRGLVLITGNGESRNHSVTVQIEYKLVAAGSWTTDTVTITDALQSPKRWQRDYTVTPGQYNVRVKVTSTRQTTLDYSELTVFSYIQERVSDDFRYPHTALLSVKALASDQISGGAPVVSCLVQREFISVKEDGSTWNDLGFDSWTNLVSNSQARLALNGGEALTLVAGMVGKYIEFQSEDMRSDMQIQAGRYLILAIDNTARTIDIEYGGLATNSGANFIYGSIMDFVDGANPAWCCYDLITHPRYGSGVDPDRLDYAKFLAWANFCSSKSYTCNITLDMDTPLSNALNMISTLGRGSVLQRGTDFSCVYDGQSSRVQLFTVGNIVEDSFNETFISRENRSNVVEISYWDADRDYERTTIEVSSADYDTTQQPEKRTNVSLPGCTSKTMASYYGRFLLNCNQYLSRNITFETGSDCIASTIGDVVGIQHDVPQWGLAGGRVVSATSNTVTLDREVACEVGTNYAIIVRKDSDDTLQEEDLANPGTGDFSTFTLSSGTWTSTPTADDVYSMGVQNLVVKDYRVTGISRGQDLNCKVTALEYRSEVYSDTETIPDYPTESFLPQVAGLRLDDAFPVDPDGVRRAVINVNWRGFALSWKVYYREYNVGAPWVLSQEVYDPTHTIRNVDIGKTYEVAVSTTDPSDGETDTVLIEINGPGAPTDLFAEILDNNVLLKWTAVEDDLPIEKFIIRKGATWATGQELGYSKTTFKSFFEQVSGTYIYHVAAVDTAGNVGDSASVTVTVDVPTDYKADTEKTIAEQSNRTLTNLIEVSTTAIVGPVSLAETWEDWWDDNGYGSGTFQDFIDDGYLTYITPDSTTTAKYESGSVDMGAVFTNATFALEIEWDILEGSDAVSVAPTMYSSPDNIVWATHSGVNRIYVAGARYIKFDIDITVPQNTKIKITKASIVAVVKTVKSNGSDTVTVANDGKAVSITASYAYADVDTIIATPGGTTSKTAVVDFTDVPNPTDFTVYLFDSDGNKTTGAFYYEIIGV